MSDWEGITEVEFDSTTMQERSGIRELGAICADQVYDMIPLDPICRSLLRAIVRLPGPSHEISLVRIVENVQNWDSAIDEALKQGVLPMLYEHLTKHGLPIPADALERMKAEYDRNTFHSLTNAAELISVLQVFEERGIPALPFKGVVLAESVYGSVTSRSAGDLDLLVFFSDLERAASLLMERGYEIKAPELSDGTPATDEQYELHLERPSDGMVLELRWRLELTKPRFRRELGMDWVWSRRQIALLAGSQVPDLDPERALLVLCMHGAKHIWSRLIWVSDVARLLERHSNLNWSEVIREAKRVGLWRPLALGVLLAHRITAAPVPGGILRKFEADRAALYLARHFDESLPQEPGRLPTARIPYFIQLLDTRDRLGMIFSLNILRPKALDRAVIQLPKSLDFLYYAIRPLRILLDRSGR